MTIMTKATDYQMQYKHWCWLKHFTPNQITDEWWLILQQLEILGVVSLNHVLKWTDIAHPNPINNSNVN